MGVTVQVDEGLFGGGPPLAWQKALRLIRSPGDKDYARRVLAAVLLSWLPLVVLTVVEAISGNPAAWSFWRDAAVHARFLITLPALVLAEGDLIPIFGRIACHFLFAGLVPSQDRDRYDNAVTSTKRLLETRAAYVVTFLLAYAAVIALIATLDRATTPAWYWSGPGKLSFSFPGAWHAFVSLPLLLWPFLGWLWRLILWWRFLALMSRIDLRLIPSHPDRAGGLRFVSLSIRGFRFLALAIGMIVAGSQINSMLQTGQPQIGVRNAAIGVVVVVVILAAGPLAMFVSRLRDARSRGAFLYGTLGRDVGKQFETKWLDAQKVIDASALGVQDFSAMTDLNQAVANVYNVADLPFNWKDLTPIVVGGLVPFVPVVLMTVPLRDIWQAVKTLLL